MTLARPVATLEARGAPHATDAGQPRGVFTTAVNRSFTQLLDGAGSAAFEFQYYLPGGQTSPDLALIDPTNTDICFWVETDSGAQCLFRGRLTDVQLASGQGGQVTVRCQARDYKSLLKQRFLINADCDHVSWGTPPAVSTPGPMQRNYDTGVDLGSVVWDLIRIMQARTAGTFGITASGDGVPTSPTTMTRHFPTTIPSQATGGYVWQGGNGTTGITLANVWEANIGAAIADQIDALGAGNEGTYDFGSGPIGTQGFEWDIVPDPTSAANKLHVWAKTNHDGRGRGTDAQWVLDWPGAAAAFSTDWSTDQLATYARVTMNSLVYGHQIDVSSTSLGRWERQVVVDTPWAPNVPQTSLLSIVVPQVDKAAVNTFFLDSTIRYSYSVTLPPTLDPTQQLAMQLGDTVRVQVPTINGISNTVERIVGRTITITDNGDLTVGLSLAKLPIFTTGARAREQKKLSDRMFRMLNGYQGGVYAP